MRVQMFQHVPFEGLGAIRGWFADRGAEIRTTQFFAGESAPSLDDVDMLIAMGGPMSVNDESDFPWLRGEKQAIRDAMAREVPVLGICLGAQLIASALGARVSRNTVKEIGWFPIQSVPAARSDRAASPAFAFPPERVVLHWHGETFDLPPGARHLASSAGCRHQAFQIGRNVLGLQFHLEMEEGDIRRIVEHCRVELLPGPYVQDETALLAGVATHGAASNRLLNEVLEYLVDGV